MTAALFFYGLTALALLAALAAGLDYVIHRVTDAWRRRRKRQGK